MAGAASRPRAHALRFLLFAGFAAIALNLFGPPSAFFGGGSAFGPGGAEPVSPDARSFRVDNSKLGETGGAGVSYRNSKNPDDVASDGAPWGSVVMGVDEGDGWLKVGDKYLPFWSGETQIIFLATEEDMDWKDDAWRRQQERLTQRRARSSPDFKMTAEETLIRQRKKAVWKAMSTRDSEGLLQADGRAFEDGKVITVTLEKPFGINFMEVNPNDPCGALIGGISDGMSAAMTGVLDVGDVLVAVNGNEIYGQPMDQALQPIIDTDGEMEVVFFRANLD